MGGLPRITKAELQRVGRERVVVYPGVEPCLKELRDTFQADDKIKKAELTLEFYIVSSGIGDIVRSTPIVANTDIFTEVWAAELYYDDDGVIWRPKSVISFTEKTRYLFLINKGISREDNYEKPYAVNAEMPDTDREIPFRNMFYVGDGPSDIPCISLIHKAATTDNHDGKENTLILYGKKAVHKAWEIGLNRGRTAPRDYENWAKDNIIEGVIRLGRAIAEEKLEKREKRRKKLSREVGYGSKKIKDRRKR